MDPERPLIKVLLVAASGRLLPLSSFSVLHPLRHEVASAKFKSLMLMQRQGPTQPLQPA